MALLISVFPVFVFLLTSSPRLHLVNDQSPLSVLFAIPIFVLMSLIICFAGGYFAVTIWRFVQNLRGHKNE